MEDRLPRRVPLTAVRERPCARPTVARYLVWHGTRHDSMHGGTEAHTPAQATRHALHDDFGRLRLAGTALTGHEHALVGATSALQRCVHHRAVCRIRYAVHVRRQVVLHGVTITPRPAHRHTCGVNRSQGGCEPPLLRPCNSHSPAPSPYAAAAQTSSTSPAGRGHTCRQSRHARLQAPCQHTEGSTYNGRR